MVQGAPRTSEMGAPMRVMCGCVLAMIMLLVPLAIDADTIQRTLSGTNTQGCYVAFQVTIDFAATGGDFASGTGTATVSFTLENFSGLYGYQDPATGNPILTGFMFNIPPGAGISLSDALVLAGSNIYSTGGRIGGETLPPGCHPVQTDEVHTNWYELQEETAEGYFGIFTNSLETQDGVKGGIVDLEVLEDCVQAGEIFSPIVIAGRVMFVLDLSYLDESLDCAVDFLTLCSHISGSEKVLSALGGKFQGADADGDESCFVADAGYCSEISVEQRSWSQIKSIYRD
jgi:hypothetical protein